MPVSPQTICREAGCSLLTNGSYCDQHAKHNQSTTDRKQYERYRNDDPLRKFYHTAQWKKVRQVVLLRDLLCRDPFRLGCTMPSQDVDHIIPVRDGGQMYDLDNLRGLCKPCHSRKTATDQRS